jgi:hypothetical protein
MASAERADSRPSAFGGHSAFAVSGIKKGRHWFAGCKVSIRALSIDLHQTKVPYSSPGHG